VSGERFPLLLSEQFEIELDELAGATGFSVEEIVELVEYGVFEPVGAARMAWRFRSRTITLGRRAARLRADFDLDTPATALVVTLLERIEELEAEVNRLRCERLGE
jgi:chaperone modulatory protein CbpM